VTDYSKGEKPAIGYTLTNDMATKDSWAGSYLNFPVRDLTLCFWYKFTDLSDRRQEHNILSAATASMYCVRGSQSCEWAFCII